MNQETLLTAEEVIKKLTTLDIKISLRLLRYYHTQGLIENTLVSKENGGFRGLYPESVIDRIQFIRELQKKGFNIDEVKLIIKEGGADLFTERLIDNLKLWRKTLKKRETGEIFTVKKYSDYSNRIKIAENAFLKANEEIEKVWRIGSPA